MTQRNTRLTHRLAGLVCLGAILFSAAAAVLPGPSASSKGGDTPAGVLLSGPRQGPPGQQPASPLEQDPLPLEDMIGYLVITPDEYYDAMIPFVLLKKSQGYGIRMARLSDIPGSGTAQEIQDYIVTAYHRWPVPPRYVLLVGDTNLIPAWSGRAGSGATDLYYGCMDGGDDWHPEISRGRFPVRSVDQVHLMVDKYVQYAQLTGEESWLRSVSFIGSCDSEHWYDTEHSHDDVIQSYTVSRGYVGSFPNPSQAGGDQLYCNTHSATSSDLQRILSEGRSIVVYSGHGWDTGWEMDFDAQMVTQLTNYGRLPFVMSLACSTGTFELRQAFGETWMLQENAGALAFFGASDLSDWYEDDVLERAFFEGLFAGSEAPEPLGYLLDRALEAVETSASGSARAYWEMYNLLGDPSLQLFLPQTWPSEKPPRFF